MSSLMDFSPDKFISFLKEKKIKRFYFVHDIETGDIKSSHNELQEIAHFLKKDTRDYEQHEGLFFEVMSECDCLLGAFIHRTNRGQGAGGTRFWNYDTIEDLLRDGLRLSKGMTHKNALAGLWWGGGKGIIVANSTVNKKDTNIREKIFQAYGQFITSLKGCYVTAEDVGTTPTDIANIFTKTRFVTCIPPELGGSGNPSTATALGVLKGMEAAVHFLDGTSLEGKVVALQGMGHVGQELIAFLFAQKVKKIIACDINEESVAKAKERFQANPLEAFVATKQDDSIFKTVCDIFAPCATGCILTPSNIDKLQTKIVCGAANNQLEDANKDDALLASKNILYVPDFLVNRMGIVNCSNEQYGYTSIDTFFERHLDEEWEHSIYQMTLKVLALSKEKGTPPGHTAIHLANKLANELHPIFEHRAYQIIQSLVEKKWCD